jgi:hypothetical protein
MFTQATEVRKSAVTMAKKETLGMQAAETR